MVAICLVLTALAVVAQEPRVVVGSKMFNESYILAEIIAQLLEDRGVSVRRNLGLGGTLVCYEALRKGEIDVYPEYSGTLEKAVLKSPRRLSYDELKSKLALEHGLVLLGSLGFSNTYAMALKRSKAEELGLRRIGDLASAGNLRYAFSHEFLNRQDGWPGLAEAYGLGGTPRGIEHGLAYQAIDDGKIDVTDVYSTDGDIEKYDLVLLEDDRGYFPRYLAAPLVHEGTTARLRAILDELSGTITEEEMQGLNAQVLLEGKSFAAVAAGFLVRERLVQAGAGHDKSGLWATLLRRTVTHLKLTLIALLGAILLAVPLGVLVYRIRGLSRAVIYVAGMLQTIPSIALLAFMIPLFGIGAVPAMVALFLYALLPILRNTATALYSIDPLLKKIGVGIGLNARQRLRYIELPLAAPNVLAGIKTAAVINIGTATLAAFIGAGGLGEPIVTGLALNDTGLILEGAIPAAVLAILAELGFEGLERVLIPRHLLSNGSE